MFDSLVKKLVISFAVIITLVTNFSCAQTLNEISSGQSVFLSNTEVNSFVSIERKTLDDLRNGTARLERLCSSPIKASDDKPSKSSIAELEVGLQLRAKKIKDLVQSSVNLTQTAFKNAQFEEQQSCSPISRIKSIFNRTPFDEKFCTTAKEKLERLQSLNTAAREWLQIHDERQKLFFRLSRLEAAGCARNGFTQKMSSLHEEALGTYEAKGLEIFENAVRTTTSNVSNAK